MVSKKLVDHLTQRTVCSTRACNRHGMEERLIATSEKENPPKAPEGTPRRD